MLILEILVVFYQWQTVIKAQSLRNPVFWQIPVEFNTSDPLDQGHLVTSESRWAISQDFQVITNGDDADYEHKRLLINMSNGCSNNTNLSTIQQWNGQVLTTAAIQPLPKMALIERGECTWHRKVSAVNYLSLLYHLNIEAMMIYDNNIHGSNAPFELLPVDSSEPQQLAQLYNTTPLPPSRNITYMKDNDLTPNSSNSSISNYLPVYFTTKSHGLYLMQLNLSYSSSDSPSSTTTTKSNTSIMDLHQFYQISPYLSTSLLNDNQENSNDNDNGFSNILTTSKGYLSYIIALVAVFLIGVILLRWWRLRRVRRQMAAAAENNGQERLHPDYILQSRTDRIDPLPVPMVNALPIVYYSVDTINNAMCVICLDDYVENKSLVRMLPCRHGFCALCIDPWLTQKSSFCPICKYDCLPSDQRQQREQQEQFNDRLHSGNQHTMDITDATTTTENDVGQLSSVASAQNNNGDDSHTSQNNSQH